VRIHSGLQALRSGWEAPSVEPSTIRRFCVRINDRDLLRQPPYAIFHAEKPTADKEKRTARVQLVCEFEDSWRKKGNLLQRR
jgi:hypothetical protein